jgi:coniferyl-aldehyde dehydrogenase
MMTNQATTNQERLHELFKLQSEASVHHQLPTSAQRKGNLQRLRREVLSRQDVLLTAVQEDFEVRPDAETCIAEVFGVASAASHAARSVRRWMRPSRRGVAWWAQPAQAQTVPQPMGVVGIIAPWNYPILLSLGPLVAALAAGNRVVIKMSEHAPATAEAVQELISASFSEAEVAVITGDSGIAEAFSKLPFDHLFYTGSGEVAKHVMRAASENLTPVTLELGGCCPAIIGPDASQGSSFDDAIEKILVGKLVNAGQTCVAPNYVLLPEGSVGRFIEVAQAVVSQRYPSPLDNLDYTSIISERHVSRLQGLLDDAQQRGAQIVPLGGCNAQPEKRRFPPCLVTGVTNDMFAVQQEIFGPILPLVTYSSLDEAIQWINQRPKALALYYFGKKDRKMITDRTRSGAVSFNQTLVHVGIEDLPFGGVGASGMGCYHGHDGFKTFSHAKPVFTQGWFNPMRWFYPPYGRRTSFLFKWLLKLAA